MIDYKHWIIRGEKKSKKKRKKSRAIKAHYKQKKYTIVNLYFTASIKFYYSYLLMPHIPISSFKNTTTGILLKLFKMKAGLLGW